MSFTLNNLTPHQVVLALADGTELRLPPSGTVPRLLLSQGSRQTLQVSRPPVPGEPGEGAPGASDAPGASGTPDTPDAPDTSGTPDALTVVATVELAVGATVTGLEPPLPEPCPGTLYVTSRVVAEHHPERTDLVWPDDLQRDAAGQVTSARRLASLHAVQPQAAHQEG